MNGPCALTTRTFNKLHSSSDAPSLDEKLKTNTTNVFIFHLKGSKRTPFIFTNSRAHLGEGMTLVKQALPLYLRSSKRYSHVFAWGRNTEGQCGLPAGA
jgi:hypothetical protein